MKTRLLLFLILALFSVSITGCNGSGSKESSSVSSTEVSASPGISGRISDAKSYVIIKDPVLKDKTLAEIAGNDAKEMERLINAGAQVKAEINESGELVIDKEATGIVSITDLSDGTKKVELQNSRYFVAEEKADGSLSVVMGEDVAAIEYPGAKE